jgi:hypothetical protein
MNGIVPAGIETLIERVFPAPKRSRRIAWRYDKLAHCFAELDFS